MSRIHYISEDLPKSFHVSDELLTYQYCTLPTNTIVSKYILSIDSFVLSIFLERSSTEIFKIVFIYSYYYFDRTRYFDKTLIWKILSSSTFCKSTSEYGVC